MPATPQSPLARGPRRRIAAIGPVTVVVVVVVAVMLAVTPERGDTTRADRRELQSLLDRWSTAVRAADVEALTSVVDATAADLLDSERRRADALASVPTDEFGYVLGPALTVPADISDRYGTATVRTHAVELRYALAGVDAEATTEPVTVSFVHRPGGWRIAADDPIPGRSVTWRGPWDHGPLEVNDVETAGGRSLVLAHPDRAEFAASVRAELPDAVDAVSDLWGTGWPQRTAIVVTSTRAEFTDLVGTRHDGDDIAAVAISDAVDPGAAHATGQRIVFNPLAGDRLTAAGLHGVLRHELTHIATRAHTVDGAPMWILEGYADYVGHRTDPPAAPTGSDLRRTAPGLVADLARTGTPTAPPADAEFGDPQRSRVAYEAAWSLAAFVADRAGESALTELYRQLAAAPADTVRTDHVVEDILGVTTGELADSWGSWLRDLLAAP